MLRKVAEYLRGIETLRGMESFEDFRREFEELVALIHRPYLK